MNAPAQPCRSGYMRVTDITLVPESSLIENFDATIDLADNSRSVAALRIRFLLDPSNAQRKCQFNGKALVIFRNSVSKATKPCREQSPMRQI